MLGPHSLHKKEKKTERNIARQERGLRLEDFDVCRNNWGKLNYNGDTLKENW